MNRVKTIKDMLKKPPYTKWEKLLKYINDKPIGTIFNRRDMRCYINGKHIPSAGKFSPTEDTYRRILTILGILENVERGQFKIIYHIRKDLSASKAKKAAYSQAWRSWFNDFKETK